MVHYIRFLRVPQIRLEGKGPVNRISAVLTVTTDLGEAYYPDDLELIVRLVDTQHPKTSVTSWGILWRKNSQVTKLNVQYESRSPSEIMQLHVSSRQTDEVLAKHSQLPEVLDVWSSSFTLNLESCADDYVERRLRLTDETYINIWEATRESIARHIWDGALGCLDLYKNILSRNDAATKMSQMHSLLSGQRSRGIRVVELGSGCGVAGIALAQMMPGTSVLLTDLEAAQEIITMNINNAILPETSSLDQEILDWDKPLSASELHKNIDLLIVCECIYNADSCPTLVDILQQFIALSPEIKILIITKRRHDSEIVFFDLMRNARLQVLEQCCLPLPHYVSEADWETPQAEIYLYGAANDTIRPK